MTDPSQPVNDQPTAFDQIIGRPDKPFHKAECCCAACETWKAANPGPQRGPASVAQVQAQAKQAAREADPSGVDLPDKPGSWKRNATATHQEYDLEVRSVLEDGMPWELRAWRVGNGREVELSMLPRGGWQQASGEREHRSWSPHEYGRRGNCGCEVCTKMKLAALTAEVQRLEGELDEARRRVADLQERLAAAGGEG